MGADEALEAFVSARSGSPRGIDFVNLGDVEFRPRLGFKQTAGLSGLRLDQSAADYERAETAPGRLPIPRISRTRSPIVVRCYVGDNLRPAFGAGRSAHPLPVGTGP